MTTTDQRPRRGSHFGDEARAAPEPARRFAPNADQEQPPHAHESEVLPTSHPVQQRAGDWIADEPLLAFGLDAKDFIRSEDSGELVRREEPEAPARPRFDARGGQGSSSGRARSAAQLLAQPHWAGVPAAPHGTAAAAATRTSLAAAPAPPQPAPSQPTPSTASPAPAAEDEVAARWRSGPALAKARQLPDAELVRELADVRHALGKLLPEDQDDDAYHALRSAQTELEFEARRRTSRKGGPRPLDSMAVPGPLSYTDEHSGRAAGSGTARTVALRKLEYAIATLGLDGTEREIRKLETKRTEQANEMAGSHATTDPMNWLRHQLALCRDEGKAFLERFEQVGRSIALGLLGESASRLQAELARYGLQRGAASRDGSLRGMGLSAGERGTAIGDALAHGREIRTAYDRARGNAGAGGAAWEDFERTKAQAIAAHPILASFLSGDTALAKAALTGLVPEATELGAVPPELLAGMIGWELNQKLADNRATTEHLETGKLSIYGAPRVVELTKLEMRVADGMMLSGVVDERVRQPPGLPWTEVLASAITVALGLLLAVPTGGASAGVALAGNLALLASDLYLIGKGAAERAVPNAAANTDVTLEQSLIDEEPGAAPLITQLLGGLGLAGGAIGVMKSAGHLQVLAQARRGIAEMRALRRTLAEHGADAMHAEVQAAAARLRATARQAGMAEDQLEAMIRTALRGSVAPRAGAGLDPAATLTADSEALLAQRLGVPRLVRTAEPGARVSVRLTPNGPLAVEQIEAAAEATVADVLMHQVTLEALARSRGALGKVREVRERLAEWVRGESKAAGAAGAGRNPHPPRSRGHELFEEVRKHEAAVERRIAALIGHLQDGGDAGKRAAWALEDQLDVLEGELAHYRLALAKAEATGGTLERGRGVIESPGDAGRAAQAKGYEPAPEGYHYHRNPHQPEEYVISRNAGRDELPRLQVHRKGDRWTLGPADEARRQRVFSAAMSDGEVLEAMLEGSPSWRLYQEALIDPGKLGLPAAQVRQRSLRAIEQTRTPGLRGSRGKAEINEDLIRRALKEEFRADVLRAALAQPTREEQVVSLRKFTEAFGFTNASDKGNLFEALLAAQDKAQLRHAVMDQARLAAMDPPVTISKDRVVDLFGPDGTLTEIKAVKTQMGKEQELQLKDYLTVVDRKVELSYRGKMVPTKKLVYAFMEPEGVLANRTFIEKALGGRATIRVYNKAGVAKNFDRGSSTIEDLMSFAVSTN